MVKENLPVKWDKTALQQLKSIFDYISLDSERNAQKVKVEILAVANSLSQQPFRFPPDKNKDDNDGSFRAFIKYKYRVAYRVSATDIRILRIRSEKQEPLAY